jgi:chromosome segregation protein
MYLKQIEVENFKSFGKKLTIPMLSGFTAVTGPNGSGKSNISDAILFVLGPKSSKAIRAGKLSDLIFNGGNAKAPANHTRVSLVFDNASSPMSETVTTPISTSTIASPLWPSSITCSPAPA